MRRASVFGMFSNLAQAKSWRSKYRMERSRILMLLMMFAFCIVIARSWWLQHLDVSDWQKRAERFYEGVRSVPANRGQILDRSGAVLASSVPVLRIGIVPKLFGRNHKYPLRVAKFAEILGLSPEALVSQIQERGRFFYVTKDLPVYHRDVIASLRLEGLEVELVYQRRYPYQEAFAQVLGLTNSDHVGVEGLERTYESFLRGKAGLRQVVQDVRGNVVGEKRLLSPPEPGRTVKLSLDASIQGAAYRALRQSVLEHDAKGGSAVVLDAQTGEILAMVNMPDFNPNDRSGLDDESLRLRAITDAIEPGSVMKPFAIATALELGLVRTSTVLDVSSGVLRIGRSSISDAHRHDQLTVAQILQKSSNVGTATIALKIPPQTLWSTYRAVGLGEVPMIGLTGATAGRLRSPERWRPIEQATMSYGHGLSMSVLQLAQAYTVFGTDGRFLPASFGRQVDLSDQAAGALGYRVYSPEVVKAIRAMLEAAAAPGGTAPKARIPGYRVGGKTGTAHIAERGGYSDVRFISSFVGLVPIEQPRLVIAVVVEEPSKGQYYGGLVAAPVFAKIAEDAMRSLNVAPDPLVVSPSPQNENWVKEASQ